MAQTINADDGVISGSTGLKFTADTTSTLALQNNGTTNLTIDSNGSVTIPNATSTSVSSGALLLTGTGGAIVIDSYGHKRISWNDGGGNFNIRAGHYYNGGLLYLADGATNGGAASITMNSDGTAGAMTFNVAAIGVGGTAVTWSNNMTYNATGLAIGYGLSPSYPLHISMATGEVYVSSSTGTNYVRYTASNTGGSFQFGIDNSGGTNYFGATAYGRAIFSDGAYPVGIFTNGSERMRIDSSGNVGINGTPTYKLDVGINNQTQSATVGSNGLIRNATGADNSPFTQARIVVYGGTTVDVTNWGYLAYGSDASMRIVYGKTGAGGPLLFGTTSALDGTGAFTERMRISMAGVVTLTNLIYHTASTAVTAAGTTQGTATALTAEINNVTTVGASSGVRLPTPAAAGLRIMVRNGSAATALNVYPHSSGNIAGVGVDAAISVDFGVTLEFIAFDTTNWYIPSAVLG